MRRISDQELINSLIVATEEDRIDWQPSGTVDQYTASFGGKWTLVIDKGQNSSGDDIFWLDVKDSAGENIVRLTPYDDNRIPALFEMARRFALKIDQALADLLKEIDKAKK
jgi:hypothetical protein